MSKRRPKIITGKLLKEFEGELGCNQISLQTILGIYTATLIKLYNAPEQPIDRQHAAIVRFIQNNPTFLDTYPVARLIRPWTFRDLVDTYDGLSAARQLKVGKERLDLENYGHIGTLLFRGYGAARNLAKGDSQCTFPTSIWIGIVIFSLENKMASAVEEVIEQEATAHKLSLDNVLQDGWPSLRGN